MGGCSFCGFATIQTRSHQFQGKHSGIGVETTPLPISHAATPEALQSSSSLEGFRRLDVADSYNQHQFFETLKTICVPLLSSTFLPLASSIELPLAELLTDTPGILCTAAIAEPPVWETSPAP